MRKRIAALVPVLSALIGAGCIVSQAFAESDPPAFETAQRDLWERGSERFQRQWLVAGPVDATAAETIDPASLHPAPGQPLSNQSEQIRWASQTSWGDVIDLDPIDKRKAISVGTPVNSTYFAAATFSRGVAGPAELAIGSERAYSVWLNGQLIHSRQTDATFVPDADRIPVDMKQGDNVVVLRFAEPVSGPSRFTLRAVAPGAVLARIDEITPAIAEATNDTLTVQTHVKQETAPAVDIEVVAAGGKVVERKSAPRGDVVKFDSSRWSDGAYEIRASTKDAWGHSSVRHLPWYKGDATAESRELIAAADKAQRGPEGDTLRMLAALVKDRLGGSLDHASRNDWPKIHSALLEFEELKANANVRPGGFVRLAYTDDVDGSTQYCRAFLPLQYSSDRKSPLMIFLHGFNPPNPEYINWWNVDDRHNPIADSRDVILIEAHGRGNAQYVRIGDHDVMRCLTEAKRRFSVDEDRVYLTGESMGGHGTWAIGTRHPDIFAAIAPVYGGWDLRVTDVNGPVAIPAATTALEAFAFERINSFAYAENLLHVPVLVTHGDADPNVLVENSRHAVRMLQRWGYDIRYHEMPGWMHEDLGQRGAIADWLLAHTRVTAPKTVRLRSIDLAGAHAYWLSVRSFERAGEVLRVTAEVVEPGVVRIDSSNVAAMRLNLPASLRGMGDNLKVIWNGKPQQIQMTSAGADLGAKISESQKRAGLEGPLPDVIATPFVIVVGTTSKDSRMREFIQAHADFLVQQWRTWQHQSPRVLKDTEVTARDEKAYSLMLLGGPNENAVTRKLSSKLPFSASSKGIVVDGRKFPVQDSVLQAIYPSPVAADRYVYVVTATSPEGMYFWRPQFVNFMQGNPLSAFDWVIQDGRRPPVGMLKLTDGYVAAGIFDASWRTQDAQIQRRDASASQWTLRHAPAKGFVPSKEALEKIAGSYEVFPGFAVTVRVEGTQVIVDQPGQPPFTLPAESDWFYLNPASGDSAEFVRDAQGNVTGIAVENMGVVKLLKRL